MLDTDAEFVVTIEPWYASSSAGAACDRVEA
jgi:hypothetical protein